MNGYNYRSYFFTTGNEVGDEKVSILKSPQLMSNYHTSSEMIKATVGGVPTLNYRTYGVPTIRSDLPAPRIRRVADHTVGAILIPYTIH